MDPNAALDKIRDVLTRAQDGYLHTDDFALLVEHVDALDGWMTDGGFIPKSWTHQRSKPTPARNVEPEDTVVREAGVKSVTAITEKVELRAHRAIYGTDAEDENDLNQQRLDALKYAASALRGINTALSLGRGGYVGQDDPTGLFFHGILTGAVIDRDNEFTAHT